ncbi:MAG: hypothetical protein KAS93_04310 [Gammaproteobacteria bacterium]|nr:hypothetical protein [Gammaproteobacteria bacterium]
MRKDIIGCCYFPTTTLFIDDRIKYLNSLKRTIDPKLSCKFYDQPLEALKFLAEDYKPIPFIQRWLTSLNSTSAELGTELEDKALTHHYTDINIATIHKEIYSPKRFDEISLIVIDHSMPSMTGLEFCEKISTSPVKKLLITGIASNELGLEALNNKVIDNFILKSDENFDQKLNGTIKQLQQDYFRDMSAGLIQNITANQRCCLNDPVFITFFNELCEKHNVSEYYLVNNSGSFVFLDNEGNISWLIVNSEQDLNEFAITAEESDSPDDIITALKNREQLLFRFTDEDAQIKESMDEWRKNMYPATKLIGQNNTYYYSLLDGIAHYSVDKRRIATYSQYRNNIT